MRKVVFFIFFVTAILLTIGVIFLEQEYKFTLPTPVPEDLAILKTGDSVNVDLPLEAGKKGAFVHFYNNDCPCSRFNINEFQSMVRRFGNEVSFIAVIQDEKKDADAEFKEKYDLGIPIISDPEGSIADALGVYSTPQAVLIREGKVFYKGNYNRARFCVSRNTKFAELALEALVNDKEPPYFPTVAYTAYGCELPSNTEQSKNSINLLTIF